MLVPIYRSAINVFWFWNNVKFSNANAEKVVKPPQNPVINKYFNAEEDKLYFSRIPTNNPIKKQPKTLVTKVAKGKLFAQYLLMIIDKK